jgi:hypothetical protein
VYHGLDSACHALVDILSGKNQGKAVIVVAEDLGFRAADLRTHMLLIWPVRPRAAIVRAALFRWAMCCCCDTPRAAAPAAVQYHARIPTIPELGVYCVLRRSHSSLAFTRHGMMVLQDHDRVSARGRWAICCLESKTFDFHTVPL